METALGFRAVKLYPTYQHWDPRDDRVYPVYRKCIELDVVVQMHMGWTAVTMFLHTYPRIVRSLDTVADRYGLLRIPQEATSRIMGGNACRLWKIDPAPMGRAPQHREATSPNAAGRDPSGPGRTRCRAGSGGPPGAA